MSGFISWREHTTTVDETIVRHERCVECGCHFSYRQNVEATGQGTSFYGIGNRHAAATADSRARHNLNVAINNAVKPVPCPDCGYYQPRMVEALREQHGHRCEPNKYAAARVAVPIEDAWRAACAENTKAAYMRFKEVWPHLTWLADKKIREVRFPPLVHRLASAAGWILWSTFAASLAIAFFFSIRGH